jgi:hypothetical protein
VAFLHATTSSAAVIFEWCGKVRSFETVSTPELQFDMMASDENNFGTFAHHFCEVWVSLMMKNKKTEQVLHFINMVSTVPELHGRFKSVPQCVNNGDFCYEMLASGPDQMFHSESMPKPGQLQEGSFGKSIRINSKLDVILQKRK